MSGNITSSETDVSYLDNIGIQLIFTGTPTGTFSVEGSNDGATWTALDFGTTIAASGAAGSHLLNINQCPYMKLRTVFTFVSSTGSLDAYISGKGW